MPSTLKNVTVTLGLVSLPAKVTTATTDPDTKLNNICLGHAADLSDPDNPVEAIEHAPTKVKTQASFGGGSGGWLVCPTCKNSDNTTFAKGKEQGGQIVIVPQEEIDKFLASDEVKKSIALTAHPTEELGNAMPAGKVYWLDVEAPVRKVYALFVRLLQERPDISYIAEFAVRSTTALYKLDVIQNALCIRELAWPEFVTAAPAVDLSLPSDKEVAMAVLLAEMALTPFDAANYQNQRAASLAAFIASAEAVDAIASTTGPVARKTGVDLTAQLAAALEAAKPKESYSFMDTIKEATEAVGWDMTNDRPIVKPAAKKAPKQKAS